MVTWENDGVIYDGVIYACYVCADKRWGTDKSPCGYFCGFDVDAFEDCRKYYMIIKAAQYYIFYMLYRDKCRCDMQTKAVVERVNCGDDLTYLHSIRLQTSYNCFTCVKITCVAIVFRYRKLYVSVTF